jgi:hypothetical protein
LSSQLVRKMGMSRFSMAFESTISLVIYLDIQIRPL